MSTGPARLVFKDSPWCSPTQPPTRRPTIIHAERNPPRNHGKSQTFSPLIDPFHVFSMSLPFFRTRVHSCCRDTPSFWQVKFVFPHTIRREVADVTPQNIPVEARLSPEFLTNVRSRCCTKVFWLAALTLAEFWSI